MILAAGPPETHGRPQRGLVVGRVEPTLLDAVVRLLHLLDSPRDIGVLAPLVLREISYRLLVGEQGPRLRQIAAGNGQARRVATAQKRLRLQEARRLMLSEGLDATTAGFRVGYESPSQFSREYRRLFGQPPLRDMALLRTASHPEQGE